MAEVTFILVVGKLGLFDIFYLATKALRHKGTK